MKKNIAILVGIVVLLVVLFGGYKVIKRYSIKSEPISKNDINMKVFTGSVSSEYEGSNTLSYSFSIPDYTISTSSPEGDLVKIGDATSTHTTVYFSYEGGRGLSPSEYISEIIAPHVSVIDETGTSTMGDYEWQLAETAGSNWYITTSKDGQWIVAVESRKIWSDESNKLVSSFKAE